MEDKTSPTAQEVVLVVFKELAEIKAMLERFSGNINLVESRLSGEINGLKARVEGLEKTRAEEKTAKGNDLKHWQIIAATLVGGAASTALQMMFQKFFH